eukprot:TRINITY_DN122061_c0_g1_i1.p1 TRINITY_DN122061_c0_g1~~TRINITY_DN122061_c0_g1_i1.p1  ORF type:complete len:240 (+),score=41.00 TRINITY_DN122061_c0_g1_i1:69-722(+)
MAVRFRDKPIGQTMKLVKNGEQLIRLTPKAGVMAKTIPKAVFSEEPVQTYSGRGRWWEIRVDDWMGGNMSILAIGFTATDPETLMSQDEGEEAQFSLPPRAHEIPRTWIIGYIRSLYWDGEQIEAEPLSAVVPLKVFSVGVLATLSGALEVYINRKLVYTYDPTEAGLLPIPTDEPLFAVLDCTSGIKKATLLSNSMPPVEGEEEEEGGGEGAEEEA